MPWPLTWLIQDNLSYAVVSNVFDPCGDYGEHACGYYHDGNLPHVCDHWDASHSHLGSALHLHLLWLINFSLYPPNLLSPLWTILRPKKFNLFSIILK